MNFLKNKIWILSGLVVVIGLYTIQKHLLKQKGLKSLQQAEQTIGTPKYRINQPTRSINLPSYLGEISGLSLSKDDSTLLAIQDEKGLLFFIHKADGRIVNQIKFAGDDDFEGIEVVDSTIYVSNHKGDLYQYPYPAEGTQLPEKANKLKTFLKSDDNIEGLGYHPPTHSLLVAAKGSGKKRSKKRKVYRFGIVNQKLDSAVFLTLNSEIITDSLGRDKKAPIFSPSAIATHPITGNIYIVSSVASAIIVVDEKGMILYTASLDRSIHRQPEGLVFDGENRLYISNEGRDGLAKVHVFKPQ